MINPSNKTGEGAVLNFGCIMSKGIGSCDTCARRCIRCYAKSTTESGGNRQLKRLASYREGEVILPWCKEEKIKQEKKKWIMIKK